VAGGARAADDEAATPYGSVVHGYRLAWHDEFSGSALDLGKWDYRTDSKMWSTQLPANDEVADGVFRILLNKQAAGGKPYTGGGVISKQQFGYGYYECRLRVPPGAGWHTAFWTMKSNGSGGTEPPDTQELDICEQDSVTPMRYNAGVHAWDDKGKDYGRKDVATPNLHAGSHVWGCEFTPERVRFFFDGRLTHQTAATHFRHGPQNIWLTCIATFMGNTKKVDDSQLPAAAEFDYVRYFAPPARAAAE
jgi:beta-glucanase (GH16 family)